MDETGTLRRQDGRYEFTFPELGLIIRGAHAEWVLEAAAEIIAESEKLRGEGRIEELGTLAEFGEAEAVEVDIARYEQKARFELVPQCVVSMGSMDYHWVSAAGRPADAEGLHQKLRRLHDMSMTRHDSFLVNEDPSVNTAG